MSDDERWQVEELQARFELEPTLEDVFVEGLFDKEIMLRSLESGAAKKVFYEIDCVNIPESLLTAHKLTSGNKQRVITLARELARITADCSYRCLVDRDLDHWLEELEKTRRLVWTAYCSLDLYFYQEELLKDILVATAKTKINDWEKYFQSFTNALRCLYALRLVDRQLSLKMTWINYEKCLAKQKGEIHFDQDAYITRLLQTNNQTGQSRKFHKELDVWNKKLKGDPRMHIRGHDFINLLSWTIQKFGGIKEFGNNTSVERLFVLIAPRVKGLSELANG